MPFLPVNREDMESRGWDALDFLFVSGDAYVDHPSFGAAVISRALEAQGFRVGMLAQPDVQARDCLLAMGVPRLGVLVSSGVVDSMVDNYTAALRRRSDDRYSPGGRAGRRPDRALTRYCALVRSQMGDVPLVVGGVEASLRRFAHYDCWDGAVRRSVLQDAQADLLVYGMGEKVIVEIAELLRKGVPVRRIVGLRGTAALLRPDAMPKDLAAFVEAHAGYRLDAASRPRKSLLGRCLPDDGKRVLLPPFDEVASDPLAYSVAFRYQFYEQDPLEGRTLVQAHGARFVVQNPPAMPMTPKELDAVAELPYERRAHPAYGPGGVPSLEEVRFSIASHRGCYGGCSFCAIALHQGRIVQRRSADSVVREAEAFVRDPDFKGYVHDVGGPTANFRAPACELQERGGVCRTRRCLSPRPCPSLRADHAEYVALLRRVRAVPGVKKVFVRSGVRYDYQQMDRGTDFLRELVEHHVSGQLKVAPEHVSPRVLALMGKPGPESYDRFRRDYAAMNRALGKDQYLVPYLISGHPGSTLEDAVLLAETLRDEGVRPEQVQDFYPTPGTASTSMQFTGLDPFTLEPVHVPGPREKILQRALLQYAKPANRALVEEALRAAGREDLIGYGPRCLVRPAGREGGPPREGPAAPSRGRGRSVRSDVRTGDPRQGDGGGHPRGDPDRGRAAREGARGPRSGPRRGPRGG